MLGECIRSLRISAGFTQAALARRAGISRRHLAALEKGANVSVAILSRVSNVLPISAVEVFGRAIAQPGRIITGYRSAFISYGGPDEAVAQRLYDDLSRAGVRCFFFPVSATPGARLSRTMAEAIREYDRVILLCSASGLNRPGVSNEIEQVLAREAEEGGAELMIPLALDGSIFSDTSALRSDIRWHVRQRVIADFRGALKDADAWRKQVRLVLTSLRRVGWHE